MGTFHDTATTTSCTFHHCPATALPEDIAQDRKVVQKMEMVLRGTQRKVRCVVCQEKAFCVRKCVPSTPKLDAFLQISKQGVASLWMFLNHNLA